MHYQIRSTKDNCYLINVTSYVPYMENRGVYILQIFPKSFVTGFVIHVHVCQHDHGAPITACV